MSALRYAAFSVWDWEEAREEDFGEVAIVVSSLTGTLFLAGERALSMLMMKETRNLYCLAMTERLDTKH